MTQDLRIQLGKSRIKSLNRGDSRFPWKKGVWESAIAAHNAGYREPEKRFPVVISSDGLLSSPKALQELIDLPDIPQVAEIERINDISGSTVGDVRICDVSWNQLKLLKDRTKWHTIIVLFPDEETKKPVRRTAWVVRSLKDGNPQPRPEIRFPVVITSHDPVDSPEALRELAGLSATPHATDAEIATSLTSSPTGTVRVCEIAYEKIRALKRSIESETIWVMSLNPETEEIEETPAWIFKSIKDSSAVPNKMHKE
ncbi:hypothetical protein F4808DRAFT_293208 [Astrocystis sublimbata]|nr:hypothetical protein F4808DRAFT_293208 [Astrocystis sublimbata]